MASTTNYNWSTPDDTSLVKDGAAAIRTLGSSIDTTTKALNPSTTLGDIEYRSSTANTNTRLGIGSSGQVLTVSGGVPAWATPATTGFVGCGLYKSTTDTIPNATATIIGWNSERFDTDAFHDTVTNNSRITIPSGKAGKYLISWQWGFNLNTNGYRQVQILLNGTQLPQSYSLVTMNGYTTQSAALVYPLSVGDYLQLEVTQNSGGNLDSVASQDFFSVVYLGA
jgi:hypothetical protein